ncbi:MULTISPECIES: RHS repeat-associated core domain-containing protein [Aequorivita]|uniref:AHH domain-containing protein n=1 Tax=Aequorivita iocasae TaxID=2803865 RepID=A0ABX7DR73_9FLAO|nr:MULTISPECIES: RHS repeat-associated core domain-containing protein [Aequorivita]QQX76518.1 AHH domain-containing protein [Aequorivita iocasae]UCA55990.1 AHH domain-containing protein [Aequorivita sp. F7]
MENARLPKSRPLRPLLSLALLLCLWPCRSQEFSTEVGKTSVQIDAAVGSPALLIDLYDDDQIALPTHDVGPLVLITAQFDTDAAPYEWLAYQIVLNVVPVDANGTGGTPYNVTLNIENNPLAAGGNYVDRAGHKILGSYGAKIRVVSRTITRPGGGIPPAATPPNVSLTARFVTDRYYGIPTAAPTGLTASIPMTGDSGGNSAPKSVLIEWDAVEGALGYELEYTWADNYSPDTQNPALPASAVPLALREFELNNTRISTGGTSFEVPAIYSAGFLVYRVRALNRNLAAISQNYYTDWTSGDGSEAHVSDWDHIAVAPHENLMNWQFQASFAEDGKKKEVASYFDGTLRNRQTVTSINSDAHAIVGEVVYDNQGRPAIEALPAPVLDSDAIKYYPDFNNNTLNAAYTHLDFDWEDPSADCEVLVNGMSTGTGASGYYGPIGTATGTTRDLVPDAQLYPFSQVEYTPDNTGRIRRKGGVGPAHQLGTGHEMEYFYTVPTQEELNRLFGYRVGNVQHYKKNMVVDPNGQVSISYLDPQGRTIATALAGDAPTNLEGLDDEGAGSGLHSTVTVDLLNKVPPTQTDTDLDNNDRYSSGRYGPLEDGLRVARQVSVSSSGTSLEFDYTAGLGNSFTACNGFQYPYVLDLSFDLRDDCGNKLAGPVNDTIGVPSTAGTNIPLEYGWDDPLSSGPLGVGTYAVHKDLRINEAALDLYAQDYLQKLKDSLSACYIDPSLFAPSVDTLICLPTDCLECADELGESDTYVLGSLIAFYNNTTFVEFVPSSTIEDVGDIDFTDSPTDINGELLIDRDPGGELDLLVRRFIREWELLIGACQDACTDSVASTCAINGSFLLQDLGQEGQYGNTSDPDDPLSVFNEDNALIRYDGNTWITSGNNWRHPDPNVPYADEYGTRSEIIVVRDADGNPAPEISITPYTGTNPDGSTYEYAYPQDLVNIGDFLAAWQPSWASSLLLYHPEICYLEYSQALCAISVDVYGEDMDPDAFDAYLRSLSYIADDIPENDITQTNKELLTNTIRLRDPYFNTALINESGTSLKDYRNGIINDALTVHYESFEDDELLVYAYKISMCNGISECENPSSPITLNDVVSDMNPASSTLTEEQKQKIWNNYVTAYISLKEKIKYVFLNIYAKEEGCYNGCIGGDESTSITNVLAAYEGTILDDIADHIADVEDDVPQFCDQAGAGAYAEKTKRFIPIDLQYDSGMDPGDAIEDMEGDNDYINWILTGNCPLLADLDAFLKGYLTETGGAGTFLPPVGTRDAGNYLSPDLFTALGGTIDPPPASISFTGAVGSGASVLNIDITEDVLLDDTIIIDAGAYSWSDYTTGIAPTGSQWRILGTSQMFYQSYDEITQRFSFQFVAQLQTGANGFQEAVFSGTTIAPIGECGTFDDGLGEVLDEQMSDPDSEYGCTRQARFNRDFIALLNALRDAGQLNNTSGYVLANLPGGEYGQSFLPEFLDDDSAGSTTWTFNGTDTYTIDSAPNPVVLITAADLAGASIANFETFHFDQTSTSSDSVTLYHTDTNGALKEMQANFTPGLPYSCCDGIPFELYFTFYKQNNRFCALPNGGTRSWFNYVYFTPKVNFNKNQPIEFNFSVDFDQGFIRDPSGYNPTIIINNVEYSFDNENLRFDTYDTCSDANNTHYPPKNRLKWLNFGSYNADYKIFNLNYNINGTTRNFEMDEGVGNPVSTDLQKSMVLNGSAQWITDPNLGVGLSLQNRGGSNVEWHDHPELIFEDGGTVAMSATIMLTSDNLNGYYYNDPGATMIQIDHEPVADPSKMYSIALLTRSIQPPCETCIPQTVPPVSCTIEYDNFINFLALESGTSNSTRIVGYTLPPTLTLENFCKFNYAYLVDSYIEYNNILNILNTDNNHFLSIAEFGDTDLNYGYNDIVAVINAYRNSPEFHTHTWKDYVNDIYLSTRFICPPAPLLPGEYTVDPNDGCLEQLLSISDTYEEEAYNNYLGQLVEEFREGYIDSAISGVIETLDMSYADKEYQYTLYYYDQAGNLAQTVSPEGADRLDINDQATNDAIDAFRAQQQGPGEAPELLPAHKLKTTYKYNSLNQLIWQQTPDGGRSWFAYDELGRIIASQDERQNTDEGIPFPYLTYVLEPNVHEDPAGTLVKMNTGWSGAGGKSIEKISGDGYVSRMVLGDQGESNDVILGLSYSAAIGIEPSVLNRVKYGIYTYSALGADRVAVYQQGTSLPLIPGVSDLYSEGDILKVERLDGQINFYRNSELLKTVAESNPTLPMIADFGLRNNGNKIFDIRLVQYNGDEKKEFFSYTTYDGLGRIREAGEFRADVDLYEISEEGRLIGYSGAPGPVNGFNFVHGSRSEITRTYYDGKVELPRSITGISNPPEYSDALFGDFSAHNARNRVTGILYYSDIVGDSAGTATSNEFDHGTFYSYDAHGNVRELIHYIPELYFPNADELHVKRIRYQYDLISGNVERVAYQEGKPDQFFHRYSYDADNRIVTAQTSSSGLIWENEAQYDYYAHGPLARAQIGDKKVQGLDYVYTLQGWLKSVNAEDLRFVANDPGKDGTVPTAKDAMGYSLAYYDGDYTAAHPASYLALSVSTDPAVPASTKDLYNGNIKQMATALRESHTLLKPLQSNRYGYDQLNRIKAMESSSITPAAIRESYGTSYSYDRNGNLDSLVRRVLNTNPAINGGQPVVMDDLSYNYRPHNNQLTMVNDANRGIAELIDYGTDLKDQDSQVPGTYNVNNPATHNYVYDRTGQLVKDRTEKLDIAWRNDGKVKEVSKDVSPPTGARIVQLTRFEYDGLGNRVAKKTTVTADPTERGTYYIRDAQGNVMAVYDAELTHNDAVSGGIALSEHHIYGSARLGMEQKDQTIFSTANLPPATDLLRKTVGDKRFELANHLGNVLAVVSDKKIPTVALGTLQFFSPDVKAYNDYYPFGMLMPGRHANTSDYRYGFQGQEMDDEIKGEGNSINYKYRMHDPRVGRFFAIDPLTHNYPHYSPYSFSGNKVINRIELEGKEDVKLDLPSQDLNIRLMDQSRIDAISKEEYLDIMNARATVAKPFFRYLTPIEDIFGLVYGGDFDGLEYNRSEAGLWAVLGVIPGSKFAKGATIITKNSKVAVSAVKLYDKLRKGASRVLKKNMKEAGKVVENHAHHILPLALIKENKAFKELVENGWDINQALNGKDLPAGFHYNHPAYTDYVSEQINVYIEKNGSKNLEKYIEKTLIPELNEAIDEAYDIYKSSKENLNTQFKDVVKAVKGAAKKE